MTVIIKPRNFDGENSDNTAIRKSGIPGFVRIPASKSHTIRRILIASLARGVSEIENPLDSLDAMSCVSVFHTMGAEITIHRGTDSSSPNPADEIGEKIIGFTVKGNVHSGGKPEHDTSHCTMRCDVGNSGTTLFLALAAAGLGSNPVEFDGDWQIRQRSAGPLLKALEGLGVRVCSAENGCVPITIEGPWKGGRVSLPCPTSQYLSALLLAAPLAPAGVVTEIDVPLLNEKPYVKMTLSYLDSQNIPYEAADDYSFFRIPGGSAWEPISGPVRGDFSSAAFPAAAAVISGGSVNLFGLDPEDTQGDKAFFDFLERMGCGIKWEQIPGEKLPLIQPAPDEQEALGVQSAELQFYEWQLTVSRKGNLKCGEFDLNDTPDLFPVMAALACFARGDTALVNVPHARIKETDRIAVMAEELGKLGVKTSEKPDGLIIHGTGGITPNEARANAGQAKKTGSSIKLDGRGDHRIVMALACAALGCNEPVEIASAESADVTYPGFLKLIGAEPCRE